MSSVAPSRILDTLAVLDAERDAREQYLAQRVAELEAESKAESKELREMLRKSTELVNQRTLTVGFLITHLREQGLGREQIEAIMSGTLDLRQEAV